jgi:hypothetical protein
MTSLEVILLDLALILAGAGVCLYVWRLAKNRGK